MDDDKTFPKKRLSIIIEAPFLNRLLEMLDAHDVPGYTVLPALAGKGKSGSWRRDALSSDAYRMVQRPAQSEPIVVSIKLSTIRASKSFPISLHQEQDIYDNSMMCKQD